MRRTLQTQKVALNRHEQRASTKSGPCALQRGPLRQTTKTRKYKGGACALQPCKQEQQNNNNNNKNAHVRALQTGPCNRNNNKTRKYKGGSCALYIQGNGAWKQQQKRASTKGGPCALQTGPCKQEQQKRASTNKGRALCSTVIQTRTTTRTKTRKYKRRGLVLYRQGHANRNNNKTRKYKGGSCALYIQGHGSNNKNAQVQRQGLCSL